MIKKAMMIYLMANSSHLMAQETVRSGIGIEVGLSNFSTITTITNNDTNSIDTFINEGTGTDVFLIYKAKNNFFYKIGSSSFSEEPLANAEMVSFNPIYWNPASNSITYLEAGYDYNFEKKKGFYWSLFGSIGVASYDMSNIGFEKFANDFNLLYLEDHNNDVYSSSNLPEERESSGYLAGGIAANYELDNLILSFSITGSSLTIKKYEGAYDFQQSIFGGYFNRVVGAEHEVKKSGSVNIKILYQF